MTDVGLNTVTAQEQPNAPKPELHPSPGLGAWLRETGGSLVFSTYQTARVFFLSALENGETVAMERIVGSAMGLAANRDSLWISNKEQAWRFANVGPRRFDYQERETDFDAVYMPRWGLFLGPCDTHDILAATHHGGRLHELLFVNTTFSCVASIDGHYNFIPVWKPSFISAIGPGDRCHLNGMGARDGKLAYVTACAETDTPLGWREQKKDGGVLIDVQSNEIMTRGLSMPHSPRWHDGRIWLLNSGTGDFGYVDPNTGRFNPIALCPGFARGLTIVGHHAVIGLSRLRPNTFASGLPIQERLAASHIEQRCGLLVIDLHTGKTMHWLTLTGGISELYDVVFLPGVQRPYTPGFSEPEKQRSLLNIPNLPDVPLAQPAAKNSAAAPEQHPSV